MEYSDIADTLVGNTSPPLSISAAIKLAFQLAHSDFSKKVAARVASTPTLAQDETKPSE